MSEEQEAAIKKLEAALKLCKKAGLSLIGMDDAITAYDTKTLKSHGYGKAETDPHTAMRATIDEGKEIAVQDGGAYCGSGGW